MRINSFIAIFVCVAMLAVSMVYIAPLAQAQGDGGTDIIGGSGGGITNPLQGSKTITDVLKKVINWMLGLVGFLALIAIIIGGARMIIDFGNEDQVKKAKATILWAVIGLAVVILSYAIINIVTSEILGTGNGPAAFTFVDTAHAQGDPTSFTAGLDSIKSVAEENKLGEARSTKEILQTIVKWLLSLVGTIAVISLVYGGFLYITSQGEENKAEQAKRIILYSVIGLLIIGLSAIIVNVVISVTQ